MSCDCSLFRHLYEDIVIAMADGRRPSRLGGEDHVRETWERVKTLECYGQGFALTKMGGSTISCPRSAGCSGARRRCSCRSSTSASTTSGSRPSARHRWWPLASSRWRAERSFRRWWAHLRWQRLPTRRAGVLLLRPRTPSFPRLGELPTWRLIARRSLLELNDMLRTPSTRVLNTHAYRRTCWEERSTCMCRQFVEPRGMHRSSCIKHKGDR